MIYNEPKVTIDLAEYQELLVYKAIVKKERIVSLHFALEEHTENIKLIHRTDKGETLVGKIYKDGFEGFPLEEFRFFIKMPKVYFGERL